MVTLSPHVKRCQHISSMPPASNCTVTEPSAFVSTDCSGWKTMVDASRTAAASNRRTVRTGFSWNVPNERLA